MRGGRREGALTHGGGILIVFLLPLLDAFLPFLLLGDLFLGGCRFGRAVIIATAVVAATLRPLLLLLPAHGGTRGAISKAGGRAV